MKDLIVWMIIWYGTWIFFNTFLRWWTEKFKSKKFVPRSIFFSIITFALFIIYYPYLNKYLPQLIIGSVLSFLIGHLLHHIKIYYKGFKKDRLFIENQAFNVLFQQTMVVLGIQFLLKYLGGNYSDYHFGILFLIGHSLIIFASWSTLRYLVFPITFIGGLLFSYLAQNFEYGVVFNLLIHQFIYIIWLYNIKDEEKI
jgi:hypothetical protein